MNVQQIMEDVTTDVIIPKEISTVLAKMDMNLTMMVTHAFINAILLLNHHTPEVHCTPHHFQVVCLLTPEFHHRTPVVHRLIPEVHRHTHHYTPEVHHRTPHRTPVVRLLTLEVHHHTPVVYHHTLLMALLHILQSEHQPTSNLPTNQDIIIWVKSRTFLFSCCFYHYCWLVVQFLAFNYCCLLNVLLLHYT